MAQVLVVDDSRLSRMLSRQALESVGHEVTEAENGALGMEALQLRTFDLIVSDLLMPVCDGVAMLKQIRSQGNSIPVLICSADIQASTRQSCEALGIDGFLNKPIKSEPLLAAVGAIVARLQSAATATA